VEELCATDASVSADAGYLEEDGDLEEGGSLDGSDVKERNVRHSASVGRRLLSLRRVLSGDADNKIRPFM